MPGAYRRVNRNLTLTFWEQLYVPEVLRGISITARHFFPNFISVFKAYFLGKPELRKIMTVYYPEELPVIPEAYRGKPVLALNEDGRERCVACGLCEVACPPKCIYIIGGMRKDGTRYPVSYTLNGSVCIFCGLCEEACPEEAIVMSHVYKNLAGYSREEMLYQKEDLLVPVDKLERRLNYIRKRMFGKCTY
ncbi:MAG: NADH-quinone oxidoreductase subunit I [bacterium]|nr:MAG: NADH-quinone oxidoreductase subunit I [bacterium]